jgi:hypothetical protein
MLRYLLMQVYQYYGVFIPLIKKEQYLEIRKSIKEIFTLKDISRSIKALLG